MNDPFSGLLWTIVIVAGVLCIGAELWDFMRVLYQHFTEDD